MPRPRRTLHLALGIYALVTFVCLLTTAPERLATHTPYNHFALLAEGWVKGRLDLGRAPPQYTGNNDFASYGDRWFISFPPFPAVLIAPLVKLAGSAEAVRDGLFFGALTGVGPAVLFLALDKLSRTGRSRRSTAENVALALLFAFGTVYWFSAVQGTVWFVAHVVGVALASIYLYASIDAAHPIVAGLALGLGFATRTSLGFAFPLFLYESYRAAARSDAPADAAIAPRLGRADLRALFDRLAPFGTAVVAVLGVLFWHNRARFGDPFEFGHRYLAITWRGRMDKWGLESYHYLGRNLAVVFTSLPYTKVTGAPFQINVHGLALWITSPWFAWAVWPKRTSAYFWALAATVAGVAVPVLLYQNSGWIQFGYRFSNDFAPFVIAMIAVGGRHLSIPFRLLAAIAIVVNAFGALTFQRGPYDRFYYIDGTQKILHQPD
ncbi:Hypothetical protein A7982_02970 [Minicystis rosea]|nr:Hypothetical protein A7982_02970 [Minicystis rosea]